MRNELLIIGYYFVILQAEKERWARKAVYELAKE
jgi:hypothetical protein